MTLLNSDSYHFSVPIAIHNYKKVKKLLKIINQLN